MQTDRKRNYTISEAAKALGITRSAVHGAIKQGRLEAEPSSVPRGMQKLSILLPTVLRFSVSEV